MSRQKSLGSADGMSGLPRHRRAGIVAWRASAALLGGILALSACQPRREASREVQGAESSFRCPVGRIVDGDTFDCISGPRIRAFAYQAPERGEPMWRDARLVLDYMIGGKTLDCIPQATDRHGRMVALCFVGKEDIGAVMVSRGVAAACPAFSDRYIALDTKRVPRPGWCSGK